MKTIDPTPHLIACTIAARDPADGPALALALDALPAGPDLAVQCCADGGYVLRGTLQAALIRAAERLERAAGVPLDLGPPSILYRETVQPGSRVAVAEVATLAEGARLTLGLEVAGTALAPAYGAPPTADCAAAAGTPGLASAVCAGVGAALAAGPLAGLGVVDCAITVTGAVLAGGGWQAAEVVASTAALARRGLVQAGGVLLEPIMLVAIALPRTQAGRVLGDLAARGGRVEVTRIERGMVAVTAEAPLARLIGYAADLDAMAGPGAQCDLAYRRFAPVAPPRAVLAGA